MFSPKELFGTVSTLPAVSDSAERKRYESLGQNTLKRHNCLNRDSADGESEFVILFGECRSALSGGEAIVSSITMTTTLKSLMNGQTQIHRSDTGDSQRPSRRQPAWHLAHGFNITGLIMAKSHTGISRTGRRVCQESDGSLFCLLLFSFLLVIIRIPACHTHGLAAPSRRNRFLFIVDNGGRRRGSWESRLACCSMLVLIWGVAEGVREDIVTLDADLDVT